MKTILATILAALVILSPGCVSTNNGTASNITYEGRMFMSFENVWDATLATYDYQMDLRVAGKIKPGDAADIDMAWNLFRKAYQAALAEAQGNTSMFAPDDVRKLANDVLTLIYATQ